ncbi:zinc-binding metallopeptidase family protein [Marinobacterium sedimentorum]|uniref:zinc-binding metallopeptidase family protein n=1 Tax=Marinobacterium sedimentorum TaxID=2927804 RepID=UPI0020C62C11|nr:putative zinc-binding peptidase [Marinobacterium sedimentorum]MCP8689110.1 putative zinc-binding peptidase [Marinobacterium sedimentorum]
MKLFTCEHCGQTLYFDNFSCIRCQHELGFLPDKMVLAALQAQGEHWVAVDAKPGEPGYRKCANYSEHNLCNWMIADSDPCKYCVACRLTQTIPDLSIEGNKTLWHRLEAEKRRLVFSLMRLDLPLDPKPEPDADGLAFAFLSDDPSKAFHEDDERVLTGHAAGLITLNIAEADNAIREDMRQQMAEPYRTLLGHFRHESGHYYWDRLVQNSEWLVPFRTLFGDETRNYQQSLQSHYKTGAPADWQNSFVSTYASSHPWEDWAETWAHYLHIADTLETARAFGLRVKPRVEEAEELSTGVPFDPYRSRNFEPLIEQWLPVTYALNNLNQSMGHPDLYPFILAPLAIEKLSFVHRIILDHREHKAQPE